MVLLRLLESSLQVQNTAITPALAVTQHAGMMNQAVMPMQLNLRQLQICLDAAATAWPDWHVRALFLLQEQCLLLC